MPSLEITIKENIVIVDEKPYHVSELFINGSISGYLAIGKHSRISGSLIIDNAEEVAMEPDGILIIGERESQLCGNRLVIYETRRGVVVELAGRVYNKDEIIIEFNEVYSSIAVSYHPMRVMLISELGGIAINDGLFSLKISIKSPSRVSQAMAKMEPVK